MGHFTVLKQKSKQCPYDCLHLSSYPLVTRPSASELLSRPFQASRVSQAVSLLLQWQMISCVILNVGAEWLNVRGHVV